MQTDGNKVFVQTLRIGKTNYQKIKIFERFLTIYSLMLCMEILGTIQSSTKLLPKSVELYFQSPESDPIKLYEHTVKY